MRYIRSLLPVFIITFIFLSIGNSLLVVTDPVESNYALTAKEMVLAGDWLSPRIYNTFWYDKPVFTYWSLCLSYTLFGYSDFATRLPFAVSGALSVTVLTYYVKRRGNSPAMANLLAAMTATSLLFWILSHSVLTDQWLLLFTETALFSLYIGITENARFHTCIAYGAAALAVLTKGPVGIVLPGLIILLYIAAERKSVYLRRVFRPEGILIFLLLCMPWFIYMYTMHGREFLDGLLGFNNITRATVSEHPEENVFYYYLLLVPAALLPWTGACFYGITHFFRKSGFPLFLTLWAGVTILFYTLMATKYPTYAYIAHIPLLYFGMLGLVRIYDREKNKTWFILTGPALFFWLLIWLAALIVRVDYIALGSMWPLLLFIPSAVFCIGAAQKLKAYTALPILVSLGTATLYILLTWQVLVPFYMYRSAVPLAEKAAALNGRIYFFEEFRTSFIYYTGREAAFIAPADYDESIRLQRDAVWTQKHLFAVEDAPVFMHRLQRGEAVSLIVPQSRLKDFEKSEFKDYMTATGQYGTFTVYMPRKGTP